MGCLMCLMGWNENDSCMISGNKFLLTGKERLVVCVFVCMPLWYVDKKTNIFFLAFSYLSSKYLNPFLEESN